MPFLRQPISGVMYLCECECLCVCMYVCMIVSMFMIVDVCLCVKVHKVHFDNGFFYHVRATKNKI